MQDNGDNTKEHETEDTAESNQKGSGEYSILVIDDDQVFAGILCRSLQRLDLTVFEAHDSISAQQINREQKPARALLDLKLDNESGLNLLPLLLADNPTLDVVILTGYSSIATAVEAIKLGARNYLCKPAGTQEILTAFETEAGNPLAPIAETPPSVDRLEWEHIQKVLHEHNGNISATARALGMHRRTLQRKLQKKPVRS